LPGSSVPYEGNLFCVSKGIQDVFISELELLINL